MTFKHQFPHHVSNPIFVSCCFVFYVGKEASIRPGGGESREEAEADHRTPGTGSHQPAPRRSQAHQNRSRKGALQVPKHDEKPEERGRVPHGGRACSWSFWLCLHDISELVIQSLAGISLFLPYLSSCSVL